MTFAPDRLESAIARVEALTDAPAREAAREAVRAVLALHREGLERVAGRLRAAGAAGVSMLRAVKEDELVAALFALHELDASSEPGAPALVPLERLTGKRPKAHERCDLCGEALGSEHAHLFDVERRKLNCACSACSLLFDSNRQRMRRVQPKLQPLTDFRLTEERWQALNVPVGLAFFSYSSALEAVVAAYPGPAGAIESMVALDAWAALVRDNDVLAHLAPDTDALLVDRLSRAPRYYILSLDECYRLTGLVRSHWQGLGGGDGPARAVEEFFRSAQAPGTARAQEETAP